MATHGVVSFYRESKNIYLLELGISTFEQDIEFGNNRLDTVRLLLILDTFSMVLALNNI